MKQLKNIVWSILNQIGLGGHVLLHLNSALKDHGWFRSYREKQSIDAAGNPIPWYTYPFLHFLKDRIRQDFSVFEYGSGNSTLWYAQRVASITAVEHDEAWYHLVKPKLPSNASTIYRARGEAYIHAVGEKQERYDIIIVDGRDRVKCVQYAKDYLTDQGIIILDNSERKYYQPAKDFLAGNGFKRIDFAGMAPIVGHETTTTVFYRAHNCLDI